MIDILLFIPRLVWDILKLIWRVVVFVAEFIWRVITAFLPIEQLTNGQWMVFVGTVLFFILAFILRKNFGSFLKAVWYLFLSIVAIFLMWAINPVGCIITVVLVIFVGAGVIKKESNFLYLALGLMWLIMIVKAVTR